LTFLISHDNMQNVQSMSNQKVKVLYIEKQGQEDKGQAELVLGL
jgi:hypothetical protein